MTYQGALILAQDFRQQEKPEDIVDFDDDALNPTFWYVDDDGKEHEVWMLDAVTAANQWLIASELRRARRGGLGSRIDRSVDLDVHPPRSPQSAAEHERARQGRSFPFYVEFVGEGEIAHVDKEPTDGSRSLEIDPQTGLALDEIYHKFPTSYRHLPHRLQSRR